MDRTSGDLTPWLAESWDTLSPTSYRLRLRSGVRFSDGTPFTSADVLFTFRALYDARVNSALGNGIRVDGLPLAVSAEDDHTIRIDFPAVYGPGLAMLDALPMLPRHRLEQALDEGRFAQAWAASAPLDTISGLGPFTISDVKAGESMTFRRNPLYFRSDAGGVLPAADEIVVRIVPDQSAEMLQLESGAADFITGGLRAEDMATLRSLEQRGAVRLHDVGVGLDPNALWFNLKPGATASLDRPWLQRVELRQAISRAVSRQRIVDTVFLGAASPIVTPVTPGHGPWHAPDVTPPAHDAAEAGRLLALLGLEDRNGDGTREDALGREARFTLLTQRGHTVRERMAAVIQEDLRRSGLAVDLVPLEVGALIARIGSGDYDAVLFGLQASAIDPAVNLDFWMPGGAFHVWNPAQPAPATEWEGRLAALMEQVVRATDQRERHRHFHDVQRLFAQELPAIYFAAPRVVLATSARLGGAKPAVLMPHLLWYPDTLHLMPR
ncbi:MAG: ABC transporter substrate-binding protein [Acidobacteriota bacterium]|nr:ABC transporter substrate-binding protein [Acidobacteriota bacterium]